MAGTSHWTTQKPDYTCKASFSTAYSMKLEVEVISKEIVKPSSPTPDQLRRCQLSFLDQVTPTIYNPLVFFYPEICDTQAKKFNISDQLKQSISNALTHFYPLAGRIMEDQLFVDCNDEGVPFQEARVKCQLSGVLENPIPCEIKKLLPFKMHDGGEEFLLGIQFNIFECGGIGIGVCISHKIGDALSFFTFVNTWAAIARGEKFVAPEFESASLFPPRNLSGYKPSTGQTKEQIITKRFVFSASKIEEIKGKYANNTGFENQTRPTRFEALSAFIWSRFVTATGVSSRPDTLCSIVLMINLRTRIDPPQPEYSFGNLYSFTMTVPSMDSTGKNCHNLVIQMKDAIKKFSKEYLKKIQDGYNPLDYFREMTVSYNKREILPLTFTSLCRFPIYEADFGWGKPIWAGSAARNNKNLVTFIDTVTGNGIEAWVSLTEDDMEKFDSDKELLAYVNAPESL